MYLYYIPILLLQVFCIYHAHKNDTTQKWFYLILFLPLAGSLIYLYTTFYNRTALQTITENVKGIVITDYRIEQLEKEMHFSDSVKTKSALADEYTRVGRYKDAIDLYTDCAQGFMSDDSELLTKLVHTHFLHQDYESVITYGQKLATDKSFKHADERADYAWALHYTGKTEQAEIIFKDMDHSFANYLSRTEYCKFLQATDRAAESKEKLAQLLGEIEQMKSPERKLQKNIFAEIKQLYDNTQHKSVKPS